jgi:hypothetical protein
MGLFNRIFGHREAFDTLPSARDLEPAPAVALRREPHPGGRREPELPGGLRPDRHPGRLLAPARAFTPTQPKLGRRQIIGRQPELARILQALLEDRGHVVLYAERGRGKTSLTNMVVETLRRGDVVVARHTCDADSTFDSILRGLMRDLPASLRAVAVGQAEGEGCEQVLPDRELRPGDMVALPQRLALRSLVCVIDEFDRVEDAATRTRIADAIKQLSDRDADLLLVIVGVSDNLDQILGQHPSIQRNVVGVHLPLFSDQDVSRLVAKGAQESGFSFPPEIVARVTVLARGMPYMAQLLALRLVQATAARDSTLVSPGDLASALAGLLADANPRVLVLYSDLTAHGQDSDMVQALRRIATAPQDAWGRLSVIEGDQGQALIAGRHLMPATWSRIKAAQVLQPYGTGSGLFVFAERSLMHHVLLLAAQGPDQGANQGADQQQHDDGDADPPVPVVLPPLPLGEARLRPFVVRPTFSRL